MSELSTKDRVSDERLAQMIESWKEIDPDFASALTELAERRKAGPVKTSGTKYVRIANVDLPGPGSSLVPKNAKAAAEALCAAFGWGAAPAGDFDWSQVYWRLQVIARSKP